MLKPKLFWGPVLAYLLLAIAINYGYVDWYLANFWYQLEGQQWLFRHHWLTQKVLHDGAHDLVVALYVLILSLFIASFTSASLKRYHYGLACLSVSLPSATLSVSLIKHLTYVDCPWSINDFGGRQDYQSWFESLWAPIEGAGHCFPAAHASSAYMFFGLYFFSLRYWPNYANRVLVTVVISGMVFGLTQQLRGAHFLSHDLTSALICWLVSYMLWQVWQSRFFKDQHSARS